MKHGLFIAMMVAAASPPGAAAQTLTSAPATAPQAPPATLPIATPPGDFPVIPSATLPTLPPATRATTAPTAPATMPGTAPAATTATTDPGLFVVKVPVPNEQKLTAAARDVRDAYADSYQKITPTEKGDFARRLLAAGTAAKLEPQHRYVLLREAADMAAGVGDLYTTMQAVDEMAAAFVLDEKKLRQQYLENILRNAAVQPHLTSRVARQYLLLAETALDADAYAEAGRLAVRASSLAADAREPALARRAGQCIAAARAGETDGEKAAAARAALARNPEDQLANLALGKFVCQVHHDFAQGVPLLAKGFDPDLKAAAQREIKAGNDADELAAAADMWWYIAAALPKNDAGQGAIREHVQTLYARAIPNLTGLAKAMAEKRAGDIEADGDADETLTVTRALWGSAPGMGADVLPAVRKLIHRDGTGIVQPAPATFGDPARGEPKSLTLTYTYRGKEHTDKIAESAVAVFPPIPREGIAVPMQDFRIVEAFWGRGMSWVDVTTKTRQLVKGPTVQFKPSVQTIGIDPAPLQPKYFVVVYEVGGRRYCRSVTQLEAITLNGK